MFEIWGTFKRDDRRNERLFRYFTKTFFQEDMLPLVPPCFSSWASYIEKTDKIIVTFRHFRYQNAPYVTLQQLQAVLKDFDSVKEKTLIELSPMAEDFNLDKGFSIPMNGNQAVLKASLKGAPIFYDPLTACAYFTYKADETHLVWLENTRSIAEKHNLIKKNGFSGIYWRYPYALPEGNWESMYEIYEKRTRC
ncbi:MAG: hypothetical protein IJE10_05660 [Clostridia bacterium]|nr:hypothetical protein [Clostridia bacterium]